MNYLQLCQRLRQEVGGAGNGPSTVLDQRGENRLYVDWIRQAWIEIQSMHNWNFLWSEGNIELQPGVQLYDMPAGLASIDTSSAVIEGSPVPYADYLDFRDAYRSPGTGRPATYTLQPNGQLKLSSFPDQVYQLGFDCFLNPVSMSENLEIPALPERFHMLIVYKAMQYYGTYENALEVFNDGRMKFENMLPGLERAELPPMFLPGAIA